MAVFAKSFGVPDATATFPNGSEQIVKVEGVPIGLATFQPGWRWSNDVRPLVGTDRCQMHHVGYMLAGRLHVESDDGSTVEIGPGDALSIRPGHDAWVVGDEPCVMLDWGGKANKYSKPRAKKKGGRR
ncbi:MAG: cupin domain-containing protein [Actinomycetota bacterium]|nr:cupin domain-containing protein [Actinomycetota bacterium]